jgi:hypothetical protein
MICCGAFALLVASGLLPDQAANNTPNWVIGLVGMIFVTAGVMIILREHTRLLDLLAALLLFSFALICGWIAVYASAEGFSGGIPFLPHGMKVSFARIMFGFGAIMCSFTFAYALKRFFRPSESAGKQGQDQSN